MKTLAIKTLISLASVDQEILTQERVMKAIEPRLHDGEETVAKAAFDACQGLSVVRLFITSRTGFAHVLKMSRRFRLLNSD